MMIIITRWSDLGHYRSIPLFSYLYNQMRKPNSTSKESFTVLAEVLKSVAHPERIAILNLIYWSSEKRMTVKVIYETLRMEQPIASRHLGILKRSGILQRESEGASTFYGFNRGNKLAEQIYKCVCNEKNM